MQRHKRTSIRSQVDAVIAGSHLVRGRQQIFVPNRLGVIMPKDNLADLDDTIVTADTLASATPGLDYLCYEADKKTLSSLWGGGREGEGVRMNAIFVGLRSVSKQGPTNLRPVASHSCPALEW